MPALPHIAAPAALSRQRAGWDTGRRLQFPARPAALPLVLLLLALSTLFLFGGDREYFYRYEPHDHHDWLSSQNLTYAENLSLRHNLLRFRSQSWDADGNPHYQDLYNRFPPGGYALIKLAILPFGDTDFRAKIYAARVLMLLLFSAAAVLAYRSLARIAGSRWDALTATLLALSSYYLLYHADMISNEITTDFFAVMLAFHGMTVFVQEGRFRQLLLKSCVALLLGWHVYAFLLPFIVFGVAGELLKAQRFSPPPPPILGRLKRNILTLWCSRYLLLGIITLLFGIAILTFNFGNEYFALEREATFRETPSVDSAIRRLGLDETYRWEPQSFWLSQFYRATMTTLPFAVNTFPARLFIVPNFRYQDYQAIVMGVLALIFCLAALAVIGVCRRPGMATLLATLIFSGFCYAVMLRHNVTIHDHEAVFHVGLPLAAYTLTLLCLRRMSRVRLAPFFAVAALAAFIFSVSEMAGVGQSRQELAVEAEQMAEYGAIRNLADARSTIYVPFPHLAIGRSGGAVFAAPYYLSGENIIFNDGYGPRKPPQAGDYRLKLIREDNPALLTPEHRHVFLYDWALYDEWLRTVDLGAPIVTASGWQVYLRDGHLTYVSPECVNQDELFLLHFVAKNAADLRSSRQEYGYDNVDFDFQRFGITLTDGTCVINRPLPDYDIIAIRTGQYTEAGRIWEGEYLMPAR